MLVAQAPACLESGREFYSEYIRAIVDQAPSFDECPGIVARLASIIATIPDIPASVAVAA